MGEMEDPALPGSGAPHPWLGDNTTHCAKGAPLLQSAPPPAE